MDQERIKAYNKSLEDTTKLYNEGKKNYDESLALYEKSKAAYNSAKAAVTFLSNSGLEASQALQLAQAVVPNPREYQAEINKPGSDPQLVLKEQRDKALKRDKASKAEKEKAEKLLQRDLKYLKELESRIKIIKKQLGVATSTKGLKSNAIRQRKQKDASIKQNKQKITWNGTKALLKKNKKAIKALAKAALLYTIALVINNQLKTLSEKTQRLAELVDKTNEIISNVQTKQDVLRARVARDAALQTLNDVEQQMSQIRDIMKSLQTIATILSLLLSVILLIPIPPFTPLKITQKVINTILTLDAITIYLGIAVSTLDGLVSEIEYQKSRLLPLSDVIDKAIESDLTPEEIGNLLNRSSQYGLLGPLTGVEYKGFTFVIKEENDPKYVVAGNKRRYAVALDRSGFVVLQSQFSFTLDPEILVQELKIQIDSNNLEA